MSCAAWTEKELSRIHQGLPPWESMSFACGGWLQFYMFGVAKALQACNMDKGVRYYGCSAGSLAAMGLVLEGSFDDCVQFIRDVCLNEAYSSKGGLFQLHTYVRTYAEQLMKTHFKPIAPGVLNISTTKLPFFEPVRISSYESAEDVVTAILSSCAAFPFAAIVKHKDGSYYADGGATDFQPIEDEDTITVSPLFFSDCDIKPSRYVPVWWSFLPPRSTATVDWLYRLGWEDCIHYMQRRGLKVELHRFSDYHDAVVDHPYNVEGQVCLDRFMGYEVKSLSHEYIAFIIDLLLLLLVVLIVRPICLLLIYVELLCRMMVAFGMLCLFTALSVGSVSAREAMSPQFLWVLNAVYWRSTRGRISVLPKAQHVLQRELRSCVACIWSLSLLLRFVSLPMASQPVRKHHELVAQSVLYRFCHHML